MKTAFTYCRLATAATALLAAPSLALATVMIGTGGTPVELTLTLVDQTNSKLSYTLDLGIDAASFWVQGQQDTGASLFRTIDPNTDAAFKSFITQANLSTTRWMLFGGGWGAPTQAEITLYTTQTNNGLLADQQKYFDKFHKIVSTDLVNNTTALSTYFSNLNIANQGVDIVLNTHDKTDNGSSMASKTAGNTRTYASRDTGFSNGSTGDGDCIISGYFCVGNPIGKSSWFYKITPALVDGDVDASPVVIDEFDNLTADGYWGFIKAPNSSKYILSYTLNGANPKSLVSTDAGTTRLSFTEYSAQSGTARLIGGLAADDVAFAGTSAVTAVPEPQGWALMLAGLSAFAGLRRLRRAPDGMQV